MVRATQSLPGEPFAATFIFTVDGQEIGRFREVSGLEAEIEIYEHDEGGVNGFVHQLPGRLRWPDIVLRGGLTKNNALQEWLRSCSGEGLEAKGNKLERSTGAITLVDRLGNYVRSWKFEGAFPRAWKGPTLAVDSTQDPQEELVIVHHGFLPEDHK